MKHIFQIHINLNSVWSCGVRSRCGASIFRQTGWRLGTAASFQKSYLKSTNISTPNNFANRPHCKTLESNIVKA